MSSPKVSIVVPVYKVEEYIDRCLDSLLNQTLKDIEIILVDDGSPDNCPKICDEYAQKDARVRVVHKQNEGLGYARNSGMEVAVGEYIAFVDSDDFVDIRMFEELYDVARGNDSDVVYCNIYKYYNEEKCFPLPAMTDRIVNFSHGDIVNNILKNMLGNEPEKRKSRTYYMSVWHGIYRNSLLKSSHIKFLSERLYLSEDIFFHLDFLPLCKVVTFIPDYFCYYCFNPVSLTGSYRSDRVEKTINMCNCIRKIIKEKGFYDVTWEKRIQRLLLGYFIFSLRSCFKNKIENNLAKTDFYMVCHYLKESGFYQTYPVKHISLKQRILVFLFKHELFFCCKILFTYA